jgi:hypothetical protein
MSTCGSLDTGRCPSLWLRVVLAHGCYTTDEPPRRSLHWTVHGTEETGMADSNVVDGSLLDAPITGVIVFRDGARVTRSGQAVIPAGLAPLVLAVNWPRSCHELSVAPWSDNPRRPMTRQPRRQSGSQRGRPAAHRTTARRPRCSPGRPPHHNAGAQLLIERQPGARDALAQRG